MCTYIVYIYIYICMYVYIIILSYYIIFRGAQKLNSFHYKDQLSHLNVMVSDCDRK